MKLVRTAMTSSYQCASRDPPDREVGMTLAWWNMYLSLPNHGTRNTGYGFVRGTEYGFPDTGYCETRVVVGHGLLWHTGYCGTRVLRDTDYGTRATVGHGLRNTGYY